MKIWSSLSIVSGVRSLGLTMSLFIGGISGNALASGDSECHFHGDKPAAEATILNCAEQHKAQLIKKGTIEATWSAIKHNSIEQISTKNGKKEWKLTFKDSAPKDKAKETLYMFFSIPGNFVASNFTGN